MDALSEILKSLKMRHTSLGTMSLSAPWGLRLKGIGAPSAHAVVSGPSCWLQLPGGSTTELQPGDLVLQTASEAFVIKSSLEAPVDDVRLAWEANGLPLFDPTLEPRSPLHLQWGGGGATTRLLGMAFGLPSRQLNPLLDALPQFIVLRRSDGTVLQWIQPTIDFLTATGPESPGFAATARLLAELVFVSIIRSHLLAGATDIKGWLRGLSDPDIARALQALHAEPGLDWTVASLASRAGQSRTAFATRFVELMGISPIQYLTQWRMSLAAERILHARPNLTQLAFELGYASDAAFREAFRRHHGVSPSRYGLGDAAPTETL